MASGCEQYMGPVVVISAYIWAVDVISGWWMYALFPCNEVLLFLLLSALLSASFLVSIQFLYMFFVFVFVTFY